MVYLTSEDPHLAYHAAFNVVSGIQSQGVIACAKHFVDNAQENERHDMSARVGDRAQHELYYEPFRGAVDAGVGSVMCAFNRINDTYACENNETLNTVLKGELGFSGFVVSDWHATHSTAKAASSGTS